MTAPRAPDRLAALRAAFAGRYELERPAGEGGMATVWLARDVKHERPVAVKVLRRELGESVGADRFAREILITARFNHPNIVPVLDSGVLELGAVRLPWYAMPYVEGPSLRDHLARNGPLPLDEALRYAAEVADALDFAHARGVVHRDVKPGNILLQAGHALVADFGIARAMDAASRAGTAMTTEGLLGTPVYMSPEQCRGEERLDGRSDLYALGCVLHEMLAGAPPFDGTTPQAVSVAHCSEPPPPLAERRPGIPPAVAALVDRALEKRPADRWATARELRDEIERVRARTSGRTEVVAPAARRPRWRAWAVAAALALAAVAGWRWWAARRAPLATTEGGVLVLGGIRDRTGGALAGDARRLDDRLRQQVQAVPALVVVDVSGEPPQPLDALRARHRADWVIGGTLDRAGDSVGLTVRLVRATGSEVAGTTRWSRDAATLLREAASLDRASPLGALRLALHRELGARRLEGLEPDSAAREAIRRALARQRGVEAAFYEVGPTRALQELAVADSLLAAVDRRRARGAAAPLRRAQLAELRSVIAGAARERFPDSAAFESPAVGMRLAIAHASDVVARAPGLPDGWALRGEQRAFLADYDGGDTLLPLARADLERATALGGPRPEPWLARARIELRLGRWREALFAARRAEDLDVLHVAVPDARPLRFSLELDLAQLDSAAATCARERAERRGTALAGTCAAELAGQRSAAPADARDALRLADSVERGGAIGTTGLLPTTLRLQAAAILWRAGLADSGERTYRRALAPWGASVPPLALLDAAAVRTARGDLDSALALAARAVREEPATARQLQVHPRFRALRGHPAFEGAVGGVSPRETRAP
jgi:serine/threonine-protein kinase